MSDVFPLVTRFFYNTAQAFYGTLVASGVFPYLMGALLIVLVLRLVVFPFTGSTSVSSDMVSASHRVGRFVNMSSPAVFHASAARRRKKAVQKRQDDYRASVARRKEAMQKRRDYYKEREKIRSELIT